MLCLIELIGNLLLWFSDFGYDRRDELDGVCQPSKGTPTQGPPAVCPEGEVYNITRGYNYD